MNPAPFHYWCERCGFTSVSNRSDLETCSATFANVDGPCGGELWFPYAYLVDLVELGWTPPKESA